MGHLAVMAVDQGLRHADEARGLVAVEPGRLDELLHLGGVGLGQLDRGRILANTDGVTRFTRSSVHWADRIVATSSS